MGVQNTQGAAQTGVSSGQVYSDTGGFSASRGNNQQNAFWQINPPEPLTDFQKLAREATGQTLPLFGHDLFRMAPSTFAPADQIPVTPEYVIGPGDEILVRMWGHDNFNGRLTVDRAGSIYIPQVGSIHVAGEHFDEVQTQIQHELSRTYRNFQLSVNMGQLRSIQVFVLGEALHPGAYTVSSLSTAFNALLASGGPTRAGSLRALEVRRAGKTVATIDLYDFLLRGDKSKDVILQSGDVLFIPAVGPQVALSGSVKHPAIYELKTGTSVKDLFDLAGGLTSTASGEKISIDRIEDHHERQALTVGMNSTGFETPLHDGDVVQVGSVLASYKQSVTIRGNLANAGRFAWHPGMHLSEVIPDRESLLTNDYWLRRNRLGRPTPLFSPVNPAEGLPANRNGLPNNRYPYPQSGATGTQPSLDGSGLNSTLPVSTPDSSQNGYLEDYELNNQYQSAQNQGATNHPTQPGRNRTSNGVQSASEESTYGSLAQQQLSARDNLAGGLRRNEVKVPSPEIDWSYAVIERLDPITLHSSLVPFNLGKLVNEHDASQDLPLQPGDIITIMSQLDIHTAQSQQTKYIRLEGEFASAGVYSVGPNETLADVVRRAGGFTGQAYLFGAAFTRESAKVMQQQRLDEYVTSLSIQLERSSAQRSVSSVTSVAAASDLAVERDMVAQLRAMRATGRIVLEFSPTSSGEQSVPALPLENGDTFTVPSRPAVVSVVGSVQGQNVFLYSPDRRIGDYLKLAGRATRIGDQRHEFVIRADGSIVSRATSGGLWSDHFESLEVNPGDTIVVPEKPIKPSLIRNVIDWSQVFSQFAIGAAAIQVIK
ncbi:MAG TPA: SLBB domain-containing protein [Acidobacteriaceae bacterium]